MATSRPRSPTSARMRSRISAAALLVNVTARICHGAHALDADEVRDAVREHARLARAGAGEDEQRPSVVVTARACSGLRRLTMRSASSPASSVRRRAPRSRCVPGRARPTLRHGREPGGLRGVIAGSRSQARVASVLATASPPPRCPGSAPPTACPSSSVRERLGGWRQLRPVEAILDRIGHRPMLAGAACHLDRHRWVACRLAPDAAARRTPIVEPRRTC